MAETPSTMIPLGTKAQDFHLQDVVSNQILSLNELKSDIGTVIMFICNHCPYVRHIQAKLVYVANVYQEKGIRFIAICSNDVENYPEDSPEKMRREAEDNHYPFPYLHDASQQTAKTYKAACTPDFYVFDKNLACVYRGRFDDSTPGNRRPVTGKDLSEALDNLIAGKKINENQIASVGCNIKWKK